MNFYFCFCLWLGWGICARGEVGEISLREAANRALTGNRRVEAARLLVDLALVERGATGCSWWPQLLGSGAALRLSNEVGAKLPDDAWISSLLDKLGVSSLSFPLLDRQLSSTGLTLYWPAFTGGKRLLARRMAELGVRMASAGREQATAEALATLVDRYFALRLAERVVAVRSDQLVAMRKHDHDASLLLQHGLLTKTEALAVKVALEEAFRALQAARIDRDLAAQALSSCFASDGDSDGTNDIDGKSDGTREIEENADGKRALPKYITSTPFFLNSVLPSEEEFRERLRVGNYALEQMSLQERVLRERVKLARSDYWPEVVLFGQQTVYAHHVPKNLVPRTVVGVGFTWNLFDGGRREASIRGAEVQQRIWQAQRQATATELQLLADQLYSTLRQSQQSVPVLRTTLRFSSALLKQRRRQFREGMATATEVIDAETNRATVAVTLLTALYQYDATLAHFLSLTAQFHSFWQFLAEGETEEDLLKE